MECKLCQYKETEKNSQRNNRNILECKLSDDLELTKQDAGNNRNILECKFNISGNTSFTKSEIIETYWNVNMRDKTDEEILAEEIIETYWNVNLAPKTMNRIARGK